MEPRPTPGSDPSVAAPVAPIKVHARFGRQRTDPKDLTPFARALQAARTAAEVTQHALARRLGIGPSAVANAESAKGSATSAVLTVEGVHEAAAMFGCDPAPLLAARERSLISYRLPNFSEDHAETAIALRAAWPKLTPAELARVRAALAGGGL